jgi:DeoR family transcriptional regulator of aga operon
MVAILSTCTVLVNILIGYHRKVTPTGPFMLAIAQTLGYNPNIMSVSTRRANIMEILASEGFVAMQRLRAELGCSEATLRRDLEYLQRAGQLRRTHGGAVLDGAHEPPFTARLGAMAGAKRRIARAAAEMIEDGQAIGFTGGTTTHQIARQLPARPGLTVVTNALTIAMELASTEARVIVTGGELRGQTFELVGPLAEPLASQIHLDLMFVGVDGMSMAGGLTTHHPVEARTNRMLIDCAASVVVVADHTKLGRRTFAQIAPIDLVATLITDSDVEAEVVAEFERHGIRVIMA